MSNPLAEPSPRALRESPAALAAQVANLRGQICAINERLDQAGLRADLNDRWLPGTMRRITGITRTCTPHCVTLRRPGEWAAVPGYR
jgi:hypothetical protein